MSYSGGRFAPLASPDMPSPLVLAHRGARQEAPENTVEAFKLALRQGADGVELDVHRTADGGLVVHHDADAAEVGVLATRSLGYIQAARPDIPTLDEVLDACAGSLVNVEIKNSPGDADYDAEDVAAELVVAAILARGTTDTVLVSSFNLATIDRVRALNPTMPTGFLTVFGIDPLDALDVCTANGHNALHPSVFMLGADMADRVCGRAHELGLQVNVWTVNDLNEIQRLAAAGVDGIVTDVPAVALAALGR
ncbi:MAG: glycerophosphodiester phosphodiesterase [Acidimicrobiia bacterium]|nr:glycerophosphodiester phosphodiesterase [Acidimicrobiia bacterium]